MFYINQCTFIIFFKLPLKCSHMWLNPPLFEHIPTSIALAIAREVLSDGLVELVGRRSVLGQLQLWQRLAVGTCAGRRMVQWWYHGSMTNKAVVTYVLLRNPVNYRCIYHGYFPGDPCSTLFTTWPMSHLRRYIQHVSSQNRHSFMTLGFGVN